MPDCFFRCLQTSLNLLRGNYGMERQRETRMEIITPSTKLVTVFNWRHIGRGVHKNSSSPPWVSPARSEGKSERCPSFPGRSRAGLGPVRWSSHPGSAIHPDSTPDCMREGRKPGFVHGARPANVSLIALCGPGDHPQPETPSAWSSASGAGDGQENSETPAP